MGAPRGTAALAGAGMRDLGDSTYASPTGGFSSEGAKERNTTLGTGAGLAAGTGLHAVSGLGTAKDERKDEGGMDKDKYLPTPRRGI